MRKQSWDPDQFPAGWLIVRYAMFALSGATAGIAAAITAGGAF